MSKGFSSQNIMSLKRVPNLAAKRGSNRDNTIRSRQASGLCFDFPTPTANARHQHNSSSSGGRSGGGGGGKSSNKYYVGTEDGIIHECSISYNEQVLRTYYGHTGAIYRVQCSPFDENKFLSCSADWTVNIWSQNKSTPLLTLESSTNDAVIDCCWSPFDSCVLASASKSGILSIWNLQKNKKDAICVRDTKSEIKQLMFAPNSPSIFCAHANGKINVYKINNISDAQPGTALQQIANLDKALSS
mmetsp:Transcript_53630/g.88957  ORF Transcript_53630/g.88957 Transcript_53630/m.88957 type:complete len:245 (+) Transcript_53630:733-1467(+)